MLKSEKGIHRKAIQRAAETGVAAESIDSRLKEIPVELDAYDTLKFLGAQLCRPATDRLREDVSTVVRVGEMEFDSPLIIPMDYPGIDLSEKGRAALYDAMAKQAAAGMKYAVLAELIPKEYFLRRSFKFILDLSSTIARQSDDQLSPEQIGQLKHADSVLIRYGSYNFLSFLGEVRRHIDPLAPLMALVGDHDNNYDSIPYVLNHGIDAVVVDISGTLLEQLRKICDSKRKFADYFGSRKKYVDRQLIFTHGPNDEGKVMKAIAMGATTAHGCVFYVPALIAYSLQDAERAEGQQYSVEEISDAVSNYMRETHGQLISLAAAIGGENIFDISDDDLRTSDPRTSIATRIKMEGIEKSWFQYHYDIMLKAFGQRGVDISTIPQDVLVEMAYQLVPKGDI